MKKGTLALLSVTLFVASAFNSCSKDEDEEDGLFVEFQTGQFVQNSCAEADSLSSPNGTQPTSIYFKNESSETVKIYWINFSGGLTLYHDNVAPGQAKTQGTFLDHPWYIATEDEECITVVTALRPAVTDTVYIRD